MSACDMDISVTSRYLDEQSEPDRSNYVLLILLPSKIVVMSQGFIRGAFICITEKADQFEVFIPEFTLSLRRTLL